LVAFRECALFQAYIPNIFSPNDDGINDSFFPQFDPAIVIQNYRMRIFDRWGSIIFETNNPAIGWRGFVRSQLAPATVYVYAIEITYTDDFGTNTKVLQGDVGLVR
ncbi:MAG: gliding motility-associated C-terminal domain-containing protein, partial [Bacteroidota bacterium]